MERDDMAVVAGSASISNIYTAGHRNGSLVYLSTPAADNIAIGTSVGSDDTEGINKALSSVGYASTTVEKTAAGVNYITAYAPIKNKSGDVVGVLGIDYIVDDLILSYKT